MDKSIDEIMLSQSDGQEQGVDHMDTSRDTKVGIKTTTTITASGRQGPTAQINPVMNSTELVEENERLKNEKLCVICLNANKNILLLPCAHLAACFDCSFALKDCPMCRTKIQATVHAFT
jgi:hypothetical protein